MSQSCRTAAFVLASIAAFGPACGASPSLPPVIGAAEIFDGDDLSGLGLRGFDPVSYFLGDGPKPGRSDMEVVWSGRAWRFAGPANRDAFLRGPAAYAPRIGGYDAEAAARGLVVGADPSLFVVREERLYLFRTPESRARFLSTADLADQAEARWPALQRSLVHP